jgi:uncharacterized protein YrrD
MQFKQGATIVTDEGKEVGHLDRVVIDPKSKNVTHIVIRKGLLISQDKVVPIQYIVTGKGDRITLQMATDKLNELPDFEETHYVALNEEELARNEKHPVFFAPISYWYPPYPEMVAVSQVQPAYEVETKFNIPMGTVAVREGAKVVTQDDQHVGDVEQVLTGAKNDRVTHFIIAKGLLLKEKKMIPIGWIDSLGEDKVRLAVGLRLVQGLPALEHA